MSREREETERLTELAQQSIIARSRTQRNPHVIYKKVSAYNRSSFTTPEPTYPTHPRVSPRDP